MKQVKLAAPVHSNLDELSKKRKKEGHAVSNKQAIVADLINKLYKKEIGK